MEKRLINPKNLSVPHRPSHDPTENISPPFIGGKDAIINQKGRRSAVICDDPNGDIRSRVFPVGNTADAFNLSKDGLEEIGFRSYSGHPGGWLRSRSRPNPVSIAGFRERMHFPFSISVELHEDQVPEF